MIGLHALDLWARPHYQFVPLVPLLAAVLAWRDTRRVEAPAPGGRWVGLAWMLVAWSLLAGGVLFASPLCGTVGALAALLTAAYLLGGPGLTSAVLPAWGFLWLAVPLPRHFDAALIGRLQALVSVWSSQLLDVLRVEHVMSGNVVEIAGRQLFVDQACSGVYSLMVLLMAVWFYEAWTRSPWPRAVVLLGFTVFWVIAGNVARVVAVVVLDTRFGIDAAQGWRHELVGLVGFLGMLAMVASTGSMLDFLASTRVARRLSALGRSFTAPYARRPGGASDDSGASDVARPRRTWLGSPALGCAFGLLLLPQLLIPGRDWDNALAQSDYHDRVFRPVNAETAPARVGGFVRTGYRSEHRDIRSTWGESSKIWEYATGSTGFAASLDYPFVGWHDLLLCYEGQGWRVISRKFEDDGVPLMTAELVNSEGKFAFVIFTLFDRGGRPLTPPDGRDVFNVLADRLNYRLFGQTDEHAPNALTHQVQVFVERTGSPVTDVERTRARTLFEQTIEAVHKQAIGDKKGPT